MLQYRLVQKTKVIEGIDSIKILPQLCGENGLKKPFLVFDQGSVVQRGSHEQLKEETGIYRELWNAQAQYYAQE